MQWLLGEPLCYSTINMELILSSIGAEFIGSSSYIKHDAIWGLFCHLFGYDFNFHEIFVDLIWHSTSTCNGYLNSLFSHRLLLFWISFCLWKVKSTVFVIDVHYHIFSKAWSVISFSFSMFSGYIFKSHCEAEIRKCAKEHPATYPGFVILWY